MADLKKSLGIPSGVAVTVGAVLGTGVLVLPALAADNAGPASLVSWALMGLMSFAFALTFGRLAALFPNAGGVASFVRRAFGRRAGFMAGSLLLGTVPLGPPIAALIGASYATTLFAGRPGRTSRWRPSSSSPPSPSTTGASNSAPGRR